MLMTRDKIILGDTENILLILKEIKMDSCDIYRILSANDHDKMDHSWIFKLKIFKFGKALQNRTMKGIAGSRYLYAMINYKIKEDASSDGKQCIAKLREKFTTGHVWIK